MRHGTPGTLSKNVCNPRRPLCVVVWLLPAIDGRADCGCARFELQRCHDNPGRTYAKCSGKRSVLLIGLALRSHFLRFFGDLTIQRLDIDLHTHAFAAL